MNQDTRRARRQRIHLLLIAAITIATIAFIALHPAIAYADTGTAAAESREALLAMVPLYSQLDNVGTEWTSCGPTSLAMALSYHGAGTMPQAVVDYGTTHTGLDGEQLYKPHDPAKVFTSPQHLYEIAAYYGDPVQGWATDSESAQTILRELLADDLPVIVDVTVSLARGGSTAAHFVVVTGIAADSTVYVNDPYGGGLGGQRRAVAWEDFYWAWQYNDDGYVGGHGWWMVAEMPEASGAKATDELPKGVEGNATDYPFLYEDLLIPADPFTLHVDIEMCIVS